MIGERRKSASEVSMDEARESCHTQNTQSKTNREIVEELKRPQIWAFFTGIQIQIVSERET